MEHEPLAPPQPGQDAPEVPSPVLEPAPVPPPKKKFSQDDLVLGVVAFAWLAGIGAALGLAGWSLRAGKYLRVFVERNELKDKERYWSVVNFGGGALWGIAFGLIVLFLLRKRGLRGGFEYIERLGHRFSPLLLAPLLPVLTIWKPWRGRELAVLALISIFGLASLGLWRLSFRTGPVIVTEGSRLQRLLRPVRTVWDAPILPPVLVALGIIGYAIFFSYYTISSHYNLQTSSLDLGLEDNLMWNLVHGGPLFKTSPLGNSDTSHMGFHHTYLAFVLGIVYRFVPRVETLLVLQATLIAAAAWPLYLLGRLRMDRRIAAVLSFAYLLYAPNHGANLYDFHYPVFMPFFMWFMLYFVERKRTTVALIFAILSMSIREDAAMCVALWGVYLCLTRTNIRFGIGIMILGAAHFYVAKMVLMPWVLGGQESFVDQYRELTIPSIKGFAGVVVTVFTNPGYTMQTLVAEPLKYVYVLQIAAPLVFLAWRRPIGLLLSFPGFFFTLLATHYEPMIMISFQYSFFWTTFTFIACVRNLDWVAQPRANGDLEGPSRQKAWALAIAGATLLASYQFGGVFQQETINGGFGPKRFGPGKVERAQHAEVKELIKLVPPMASIVSNEVLVPHVSGRPNAYTMRVGVFDAEYMLFHVPSGGVEHDTVKRELTTGEFGVVKRTAGFALAKRGYKKDLNADVLRSF